MQKFKTLADVIALAEFAHRNQEDKACLPYIDHPRRVMQAVQAQGAMPYVQMAAILHDVTEDTAFTPEMLLDLGVPEAAVNIVKLLDRDYSARVLGTDWIDRLTSEELQLLSASNPNRAEDDKRLRKMVYDDFYYKNIRNNPAALQVKLADIGDNLQPWRLSYLTAEKQEYLREKYAKAINLLTGE